MKTNPVNNKGSDRVIRGGSWFIIAGYARSAYRSGSWPGFRFYYFGVRLVRTRKERKSNND